MKEAQPRLLSNMEIVMLVAVILGMLWFWLRDVFASSRDARWTKLRSVTLVETPLLQNTVFAAETRE